MFTKASKVDKTLDEIFPLFQEWMLKKYLTVGMSLISLKCWYEFINQIKEENKNALH